MKSNFGTGVEKFLFRKRRDHWPNRSCVFRHRFVKSSLGFLRSLLRERVFKWSFQSILETLCSNLYDSAFSIVHLLPFFPFFLFFFSFTILIWKEGDLAHLLVSNSTPIANRLTTLVLHHHQSFFDNDVGNVFNTWYFSRKKMRI